MRLRVSILGRSVIVAGAIGVAALPARAQRATAESTWQGKSAAFEYTATRVGKHSVDELPVGETWRLGSGPATVLTLEAPLLIEGQEVIAPGRYRAQLSRRAEDQFDVTIEGGGRLVGAGDNAELKGNLDAATTTGKTTGKTLEMKFDVAVEQPDAELRKLALIITFGGPRVTAPATLIGTITKKGGGAAIDGFKLPAEFVIKRLDLLPTPIATVTLTSGSKDAPKSFNVLLSEKEAQFVAHDAAPTDAFAPVPAHDRQWDRKGTVTWTEIADEATHFTLDDAKWEKGKQLTLVARVGKRKAEIVIPLKEAK
ncbi:MAG: DUF2911 domain-containing protein [Planctomycetes bacterium]|nr:DUF2911 domain-containing protein [Planctomycetota bacterium]